MRSLELDEARPAWPRYALAGLAAWFVLSLVWAGQPVTDHVPTGMIDGAPSSQEVRCHSVLSSSDQPAEPVPVLEPPREYTRPPCEGPHGQNRLILAIDIVFALVVGGVLVQRIRADGRGGAPALPSSEGRQVGSDR